MPSFSKVLVIGLDGLEPSLVEALLAAGRLPNLARLRDQGHYARVATTSPAQTPVAWSTFATGVNPGRHGIFDFIRRHPQNYTPDLSFSRYEQKNPFVHPKAVNLRQGTPVWQTLSEAGLTATILRCPCTYPPDPLHGHMLAGMGVPDLRGSLGVATFYTSAANVPAGTAETVLTLTPANPDGILTTQILGPRNPRGGHFNVKLTLRPRGDSLLLAADGPSHGLDLRVGQWSDWLKVKFKTGLFQSVRGMLRFYLVRLKPYLELYASPINFDPEAPLFPISSPPEYGRDLEQRIGTFYTTGMVEDHEGLSNGRFDEEAFLAQCQQVLAEREQMMLAELQGFDSGLFYCLFDTPDRLQHMFWRFREADHPANRKYGRCADRFAQVIEDHYSACDTIVRKVLDHVDDRTLLIVLSDHGFNSFQRGINLNTWLHQEGLLAFKDGVSPGPEAGDFFHQVDWSRTKAYALGLSGIYLNRRDREGQGILSDADAASLTRQLSERLTGLTDPERAQSAIRTAQPREAVYQGPCTSDAPDLLLHCGPGYRISWGTALGGAPAGVFEDNTKKWGGDHIIDPVLVPGVLFMNRPFRGEQARLLDLAPSILDGLDVPIPSTLEGASLLS